MRAWLPVTPSVPGTVIGTVQGGTNPTAAGSLGARLAARTGTTRRVLVVDDDLHVRAVTEAFLLTDGHEVHTACNAEEALKLFHNSRFDIVITDHAMPGASGEQLAVQVKAARREVPVVLLTGFGDFMHASGHHPAGVDRILAKPTNRRYLCEAVAELTAGLSSRSK